MNETFAPSQETSLLANICAPLKRRDQRKIETKERIYDAAMRLLSERDFDSVTVEMITEAAEVGKGTFFNYFKNKEHVVAYHFEMLRQLLIESFSLPMPETSPDACPHAAFWKGDPPGPVARQILLTAHMVAQFDGKSRKLARTLLALAMVNDTVRQASLAVKEEVFKAARSLIEAGQRSGELRDDFPPETLSNYLRNVYFSSVYSWAQQDMDIPLGEWMAPFILMSISAVRKQK